MAFDSPPHRRTADPVPVATPADGPPRIPVAVPADDFPEPPRRRRSRRDEDDEDDDRPRRKERKKPHPATGFLITCGFYGALLWTMIAYMVAVGVYLTVKYSDYDTLPPHVVKDRAVTDGFVLGGIHAMLVLICVLATWRPPRLPDRAEPVIAWAVALPALAGMLVINFGFGLALRFFVEVIVGVKPEPDDGSDLSFRDGWVAVLLICVQPAVVEELFFRFLLLGHLRAHVGMHLAVWVSSVFFAAAHLGQLIAFPVLLVLGAVMGYARVYSGGLALPILIHFLHNLAVIWLGPYVEQIRFS